MTVRSLKKYVVRDPAQTRAKLLRATIELITKKGPDGVSVKEAAQLAKVSRAVAYQHFRDRRHLLREARAGITNQFSHLLTKFGPGTMEERVHRSAMLVLENPELSQLFIMEAMTGKGLNIDHPIYKELVSTVKSFATGETARKGVDVEMLCFILLGAIPTSFLIGRHLHKHSSKELADRFTREWMQVLQRGIFAESPSSPGPQTLRTKRPARATKKVDRTR